jgi:cytochrome c biogenesis protein CcmG, thiol:disulfide interchange protein DsbE
MRPRRWRLVAALAAAAAMAAVVAVGIVLVSVGDGGSPGATPAAASPRASEDLRAAPNLSGVDPVSGKDVSLADFRSKPVVVNVWASWCPGCNEEAADLRRFAAAHPEAVVLGVDFQDTQAGARDFYQRWGWTHASIWDVSGTQTAALGLQGLPTTYFLTADHKIAAQVVGASDFAGFEQGLEAAKRTS